MTESDGSTRRRFLRVAGSAAVVGVAGCTGGNGGETTTTAGDGDQDLSGPVPEEYRTATSIGGVERNVDGLQGKEALEYQSEPQDGQQCSGCTYYIEDKNGDGLGACAIVEGLIEPDGYCVSYSPNQE